MITVSNLPTDRLLDFKFVEKYKHIDPNSYIAGFQNPDWHIKMKEMLNELFWSFNGEKKPKEWIEKRKEIVKMVEELMKANLIAFGTSGKNHDAERKPADTVIIHHTSTKNTAKLSYIDALCLIRLYAKAYSDKDNSEFGKPIWSNHLRDGRQTFIPYHYIIRRDGTFEKCLADEMIGWHAGNWEMNCRSIAIAFLDDLENSRPTELAMKTAANIIKKYNIKADNILGHKEVNPKIACPGKLFEEWKKEIVSSLSG